MEHTVEKQALVWLSRPEAASEASPWPFPLSLDWPWLLQAAEEHRVGPLVSYRLLNNKEIWQALPLEARRQAFLWTQFAAARYRAISTEIAPVLNALSRGGARAIVLKGPALALLYPAVHLRTFGDLDLFLSATDVERAGSILLDLGYSPNKPQVGGHEFIGHPVYSKTFPGTDQTWSVEFHGPRHLWFGPLGLVDTAEWLDNVEPVTLCGASVFALSKEDHLLFLCYHTWKHNTGTRRLRNILDLFLVIHQGLNWPQFLAKVRSYTAASEKALALIEQSVPFLTLDPSGKELEFLRTGTLPAMVYGALASIDEFYGPVVPSTVLNALRPSPSEQKHADLFFGPERKRYVWAVSHWRRIMDFPEVSFLFPDRIESLVEAGILQFWWQRQAPPFWENSAEAVELFQNFPRFRPTTP